MLTLITFKEVIARNSFLKANEKHFTALIKNSNFSIQKKFFSYYKIDRKRWSGKQKTDEARKIYYACLVNPNM